MKNKFYLISLLIFVLIGLIGIIFQWVWYIYIIALPIIFLGISDLSQTKHSLKYNFPVIGRMRWWAEWLRPKVYQYFVESDTDGAPLID